MRRYYRLASPSHWRAGASRGFGEQDDALIAERPVTARRLGEEMGDLLASPIGCGQIRLLDRRTGAIWTHYPFGLESDGKVVAADSPFAFSANASWLWIGQDNRLMRYDASTLHLIGELSIPGLWAIAPDAYDGVWTISGRDGATIVHHVDSWGRLSHRNFVTETKAATGRIATAPRGDWLVCLTLSGGGWTLSVIDLVSCKVESRFQVEPASVEDRPAVAIDAFGSILILCRPDRLVRYSREGKIVSDDELGLPSSALPTAGLFSADDQLVVVAQDGLFTVEPAAPNSEEGRTAIFVTPAMVSPEGTPSGWNRADVDVELPEGTSLKISVVASSSPGFISSFNQLFAAQSMPPAARFDAIDTMFQSASAVRQGWDRLYPGAGKRVRLHFLLDQLPETHLWLRLEATTAAGSNPPVLHQIVVHYPDRSWLDDLPAIYRENEGPAAQLRQFLAPLEVLFDGLDTRIALLPADIHSDTAPAHRLDELLGWLGFPSTAGLGEDVKRRLLRNAGSLLVRRGTLAALSEILAIVTEDRAQVTDSAAEAFLWTLGASPARTTARLGVDTRVVAARPPAFRVGKVKVGGAILGDGGCVDVAELARNACATVRIRIAVEGSERAIMEPIIAALCEIFVPGHCRLRIHYVRPGSLTPQQLLDDNATLNGDAGEPLGGNSRAGRWRLPSETQSILSLDAHADLSGERRLA